MCGFAGFFAADRMLSGDAMDAITVRMSDTLRHRGPDDRGTWIDPKAGVALGFRRLAIVDLSPEGHQPMVSANQRFVLVFNGEIYNHVALRKELLKAGAPPFRGHSDTEMMLAAFELWGLEHSLERFVGMFSFALWDRHEHTLQLARDRIGEKPLYYGRAGRALVFGSELKALRAFPDFQGEIDREALAYYMRLGYIPAPLSIYRGIEKLPPGTMVTIRDPIVLAKPASYWSASDRHQMGVLTPFHGTATEATDQLEDLLREAVGLQMVADVPLGAFLSGGVDSTTIAALMQVQSRRPVKTFTIGFDEAGFDEARHAKAVAAHLGTEHTELYVTPLEAQEVIPSLPTLYDEPFADSSAIPTFLVSRMARRDVTVSLSGDGGDELFGGYDWYPRSARLWNKVRRVPLGLRRSTARVLAGLVPEEVQSVHRAGRLGRIGQFASRDRLIKMAALLGRSAEPEEVHWALLSTWGGLRSVVLGAKNGNSILSGWESQSRLGDAVSRLILTDMLTYLPGDILTKVDRASMGVSLEARAPFLDHRVVEFALRLPTEWKLRDGSGKWLLRQVLDRYVPRTLIERPKMGFSVPIGTWLRGPLRGWAEELLEERRLRQEGYLDPMSILRKWEEHGVGSRNWTAHLWNVLMFEAWLESSKK